MDMYVYKEVGINKLLLAVGFEVVLCMRILLSVRLIWERLLSACQLQKKS